MYKVLRYYMESKELWEQYELSYFDHLLFLKKKYGLPEGSYFLTESCKSTNNKIKRTKEGLYIHHDYEWNKDDPSCHSLSSYDQAIERPFDFQLSANLTYCNLLEHLMLHMKIYRLRAEVYGPGFFDGTENYLIPQINDLFNRKHFKQEWIVKSKEAIQDNWEDYQKLVELYAQDAMVYADDLFNLSLSAVYKYGY